jgi:hypothetical protein
VAGILADDHVDIAAKQEAAGVAVRSKAIQTRLPPRPASLSAVAMPRFAAPIDRRVRACRAAGTLRRGSRLVVVPALDCGDQLRILARQYLIEA